MSTDTESNIFEICTRAAGVEKTFKTIEDLRHYLYEYNYKDNELVEVFILNKKSSVLSSFKLWSFSCFEAWVVRWAELQLHFTQKMPATLKEWVRTQYSNDELHDIANHGCVQGVTGLCYYKETCEIYEQYDAAIWEMAAQQAKDLGHDNVMQMLGRFNGANDVYCTDTFKNLMVWYAVEELASQILNEIEAKE